MNDPLWMTADGRLLRIGQMDTSHIENCIKKIRRSRKGWRKEYLERLELELYVRSIGGHTQSMQ